MNTTNKCCLNIDNIFVCNSLNNNDMFSCHRIGFGLAYIFGGRIFSALFSWFQYQFQIESLGNLAVYLDGMTLTSQNLSANLKSIQMNAILSANKKIFGYIIVAGFGILLFVLTHHFGEEKIQISKIDKVNQRKICHRKKKTSRTQKIIRRNKKMRQGTCHLNYLVFTCEVSFYFENGTLLFYYF
ncbi:hypothetical protein [Chryseobacterium indoltheticum]|uniref:hypothetical protein n=1 Tax=Chryseobacterium indoltheticum TaxID=254 RepID=UPI003F490F80